MASAALRWARVHKVFDRVREDVRATLGLSAHEFQAACEYLAAYPLEFDHALRALREGENLIVIDEPGAQVQ